MAAAREVFASLDEVRPGGVEHASCRAQDDSFVILLQIADGMQNPLPGIPAWTEFQRRLRGMLSGPPQQEELTVVGTYDLF